MHLEALKNRLETGISPAVVSSFMNHDMNQAKKYHSIFKKLDRYQMQ